MGVYLIPKLLGPTADYLGGELQAFTEKRVNNIKNIFLNARDKLGDKRLNGPGSVSPKVLKVIINDGSYSDDDLAVEYFGGVLASSKAEAGRDDRGSRLARAIDDLSTYQLRSHYLIYAAVSELFSADRNSFATTATRSRMQLFVPLLTYLNAMDFTQPERTPQILDHIFHGLSKDGLIEGMWQYGPQQELRKHFSTVSGDGIVCTPSAFGAELMLWAFGHGDKALNFLLLDDFSAAIEGIARLASPPVEALTSS